MSSTDSKTLKLLVALNRFTSTNQITWMLSEPPAKIVRGTDTVVPLCFLAVYRNATYALYQERVRLYDGDRDTFYWTENIVLAVLDNADHVLLEVRRSYAALTDLFDTVRAKLLSIDDLLKDFDKNGSDPT